MKGGFGPLRVEVPAALTIAFWNSYRQRSDRVTALSPSRPTFVRRKISQFALNGLRQHSANDRSPAGENAFYSAQQTGICELHKTAMTRKTVPIIYGMPTWEGADPGTRLRLFPHAQEKFFGGCGVLADKTRALYICSDCQRAETAWKKSNQK
jgi:hypothetical protein